MSKKKPGEEGEEWKEEKKKKEEEEEEKSVVFPSVTMSTAFRNVYDPTNVCSMTRKYWV